MDISSSKTDGWLHKQGEKGLVKVWKKRWFVLKGSRLYYYISGSDQKEKGYIDLESATAIARKPESQREFQIVTPTRVYNLLAPTQEELEEWIATIRNHTKHCRSPGGELSPRMSEIQTLRDRCAMLSQQIEQRDAQLVATNSQHQQGVRFLRELRQQLADATTDIKFKQERIDRMQAALELNQQKLTQSEAVATALRAELALLRVDAEASRKDIVQADNKVLNQLRDELRKRDVDLETARKRIAELEQAQREMLLAHIREDLHTAITGAKSPRAEVQKCLALYDYTPRNSNELAIRKHDVITLHDASPSGWWKGEIEGRIGLFPGSYGVILEEGGDVLMKKFATRRSTRIESLLREAGFDKLEKASPTQSPLIVRRSSLQNSRRKLSEVAAAATLAAKNSNAQSAPASAPTPAPAAAAEQSLPPAKASAPVVPKGDKPSALATETSSAPAAAATLPTTTAAPEPLPPSRSVAVPITPWQSSHTGGSPPPRDGLLVNAIRTPPGLSPRNPQPDEPSPQIVPGSLPMRPLSPPPLRPISPPPMRPISPPPARPQPAIPAHIEAERSAAATPSPPAVRPPPAVNPSVPIAIKAIPGQSASWMRRGSESGVSGEGSPATNSGSFIAAPLTGHHRQLANSTQSQYSPSPPPGRAVPPVPVRATVAVEEYTAALPQPPTSTSQHQTTAQPTSPAPALAKPAATAPQVAHPTSSYIPSVHQPPKVIPPLALSIATPLPVSPQKSPRPASPQRAGAGGLPATSQPSSQAVSTAASVPARLSPRPAPPASSGPVVAKEPPPREAKPDKSPVMPRVPPPPVPAAPFPPQGTPNVSAPVCFECRSAFAGFRKRWACYNCGHSFCGPCSAFQAPLPHLGFTEPVRVCVSCAAKISTAQPLPQPVETVAESTSTGPVLKSVLKQPQL